MFGFRSAGALLAGATIVAGGGSYDSEISWDISADLSMLGMEPFVLAGAAGEQSTCPVPGCTDGSANNFNADATVDDGSVLTMYLVVHASADNQMQM